MVLNDKTTNGTIIGRSLLIEEADKYVINQRTEIISPLEEFDSSFAYVVLNNSFREKVKKIVQGGTQIYVNYSAVENLTLELPSIKEQKKIGSFFKVLDNLITLHQRKLKILKQLKQAMLQKMFPAKDKKVPELRFKGFLEEWEQGKLGEYVIIKSGWSPSNFEVTDEIGSLFIKVDDLNYSNRVQSDSLLKVNIHPKYKKMKKGSTLFPKRGAAIMTNKVRILGDDGYIDTNMMALEPNGIDSEFLYTFIDRIGLYKIADTSTIPQINNKHIEPYEINLPKLKEQIEIGLSFKQLDYIITLHQSKLKKLKLLKQAYLQKMFI